MTTATPVQENAPVFVPTSIHVCNKTTSSNHTYTMRRIRRLTKSAEKPEGKRKSLLRRFSAPQLKERPALLKKTLSCEDHTEEEEKYNEEEQTVYHSVDGGETVAFWEEEHEGELEQSSLQAWGKLLLQNKR
jgi:hypothetical protein